MLHRKLLQSKTWEEFQNLDLEQRAPYFVQST